MRKLAIILFLLVDLAGIAQSRAIDSLKIRLKHSASDTIQANDLNELAWQFIDYSTDSSDKYVQKALSLSQQLKFVNGIAESKNTIGILLRYAGQSEKAIKIYEELLILRQQQGRVDKLTGTYSNLGSVYYEKGDNANALKYYLKSYDNAEKLKQTENQMILLNNLGNAYKASGLYDLAIDAFKKGIQLNKVFNDEYQTATFYANLATVYDEMNLFQESVNYTKQAYDIFKRNNYIRQLSSVVNNLGLSTRHLNDYKATEKYLKEMKEIADELKENAYYVMYHQSNANYNNDIEKFAIALREADLAISYGDSIDYRTAYGTSFLIKANILLNMKNYLTGMKNYDRGISFVKDDDDLHHLASAYIGKSQAYRAQGDYKSALTFYQRAKDINDSLNTEDYNTKIATLNALNNLDKKDKELQLSQKEKESAEAKSKQQTQFLIAAVIIGILILVLLAFSIRAFLVKKKDNELLNSQKKEIEVKNKTLHVQKVEIEHQIHLIEEKQKEILDSIHYAKRIQGALLANQELINKNLPDNFILFKPKDIVSGDFYWVTEKEDRFYLAVCDSTGHGVPGAFMSLLNISFLNEAVNEKNIVAPNDVLNHVRNKLIENISQDGAKDGMDGILICIDRKASTLTYAAANNKPVLVSADKMIEYPADKMPIGKGENLVPFTLHTLQYAKGDLLYLYSDGYADQFGGPNGKKFKYKPLQSELLNNAQVPLAEQKRRLDEVFENWKGQLEQVDDMLLVGLRL